MEVVCKICKICTGDRLERVRTLLESKGYKTEVTGCIGLCAKYGCGNINVMIGEKEISAKSFEEFKELIGDA